MAQYARNGLRIHGGRALDRPRGGREPDGDCPGVRWPGRAVCARGIRQRARRRRESGVSRAYPAAVLARLTALKDAVDLGGWCFSPRGGPGVR